MLIIYKFEPIQYIPIARKFLTNHNFKMANIINTNLSIQTFVLMLLTICNAECSKNCYWTFLLNVEENNLTNSGIEPLSLSILHQVLLKRSIV